MILYETARKALKTAQGNGGKLPNQDTHQDIDADILWADIKADFCKTLTANQLSVFNECLIGGKGMVEYASAHGVTRRSVYDAIVLIRKSEKNILCDTWHGAKNVH